MENLVFALIVMAILLFVLVLKIIALEKEALDRDIRTLDAMELFREAVYERLQRLEERVRELEK